MSAWSGYQSDILAAGGWPNTSANRQFLTDWHGAEGSPCTNNPLNNSQDVAAESGIQTTPCMGSGGVCINAPYCIANYASPADGARGTANAIKRHAPDVAAMLATGKGYEALSQAAINEIYSWGSHFFANSLSPGKSPATGGGGQTSGGGSGGGSGSTGGQRRNRGGTVNDQIVFGIPGTPDLPWQTIFNPLDLPGTLFGWLKGTASGIADLPSALVGLAKTALAAFKFFVWLLDPKHWVMILEVLFGAVLILKALHDFGQLFSAPDSGGTTKVLRGGLAVGRRETAPRSTSSRRTSTQRTEARVQRGVKRRKRARRAAMIARTFAK